MKMDGQVEQYVTMGDDRPCTLGRPASMPDLHTANTEVQLLWLSRWCTSWEGLQRIHILPGSEVRIARKWVSFPTRRIWSDDQNTKLKRSVAHKKCLGLSSKLCMDFIVEFVDKSYFWIPFVGVVEGCKLICLNLDTYSFDSSSSTISKIPICMFKAGMCYDD